MTDNTPSSTIKNNLQFDFGEVLKRSLKYSLEGLAVAVALDTSLKKLLK